MRKILGKILRWLVYVAAAAVMLLAILVGVARLLLPQVPEYQNEIRRWARDATGFNFDFGYISASWPLAGPELKFFDVIVSQGSGATVLDAEYLTVGVSLVRLVLDREVAIGQIGIGGTEVSVQRTADGVLFAQGLPIDELLPFDSPAGEIGVPEVKIRLQDVALSYQDDARANGALEVLLEQLEVKLSDDGIAIDGSVELADSMGGRAELSLDLPRRLFQPDPGADAEAPGPAWNAYVAIEDLQVVQLLAFWLDMEVPLRRGYGDIVVWAEFEGLLPDNATIEVDLESLEFDGANGVGEVYEALSGQLEWGRSEYGWIVSGSDVEIERNDRAWPESDFSVDYRIDEVTGSRRISGDATFLRLHDLYPMVLAIASPDVREGLLPPDIRGDVSDLRVAIDLTAEQPPRYKFAMRFDDLGIEIASGEAVSGISGNVDAEQSGGRLEIRSTESRINLPEIFRQPLAVDSIDGFFIWRVTDRQIRVLSDEVRIRAGAVAGNTRFELSVPRDGESPRIDLTASATLENVREALKFLPTQKLKPRLVEWLDRAIVAGRVTDAQFQLRGALREFPFERGEGIFRIDLEGVDGIVDYAPGWPRIEKADATIVFDGAGFEVTRNSGLISGIPFSGARVRIDDLRQGLLEVSARGKADVADVLGFLRASPVADAVGPTIGKIRGRGTVDGKLQLSLPVTRPTEFALLVDATTEDAEIGMENLDFGFTALKGALRLENTRVRVDQMQGLLLDEPVKIQVRPSMNAESPYSHYALVTGSTPVNRWMTALNLPFPERFEGEVAWDAMAMIPVRREDSAASFHILARSDLRGVASTLPEPLAKTTDALAALEADVAFPEDGVIEVFARLRKAISLALRLQSVEDRWEIERGAIRGGAAAASLPTEPGVELSGRFTRLRFDDWLALTEGESESSWMELYRKADLNIDRLLAFGYAFPDVEVAARRGESEWRIDLEGPYVNGGLNVPLTISPGAPIRIEFERLWLIEDDGTEPGSRDPRDIQPLLIRADDFMLGDMRFGALDAAVKKVSYGISVDPIRTQAKAFGIGANVDWLVHPNDETIQQCRLRLELDGNDIKNTLLQLGYAPVIEGVVARVDADVSWEGSPSNDFLDHADGTLSVRMEQGALLELEPGGGRLLGVLSVAALPRRLSLDFSDVFDEGLNFDTLKGNFVLDDGNAYTCNLSLEGSVADIGVVGRAGIRTEDYDQLAVVRPHVSNVFAIGGTVVGGPAVGAAMLLFSQIFKKPLSAFGESYYRVAGDWADPAVKRLQGGDLDLEPIRNCERNIAELKAPAPAPESPSPQPE